MYNLHNSPFTLLFLVPICRNYRKKLLLKFYREFLNFLLLSFTFHQEWNNLMITFFQTINVTAKLYMNFNNNIHFVVMFNMSFEYVCVYEKSFVFPFNYFE